MGRKKSRERLVNVAVMAAIRQPLTYLVPDSMEVRPGQRVVVPLGARQVVGVALEPVERLAPGIKVRAILRVLDPGPVLSPELLTLGLWIQDYYLAPVGEVFSAMLPLRAETQRARVLELTSLGKQQLEELSGSLLEEVQGCEEAGFLRFLARQTETTVDAVRRKFRGSPTLLERALKEGWVTLSRVDRERTRRETLAVSLAAPLPMPLATGPFPRARPRPSPVARRILEVLEQQGSAQDHRTLLKSARASLAHLKKLSQAGLVELRETTGGLSRLENGLAGAGPAVIGSPPALNAAQGQVLDELRARLDAREFSAALLQGVTASGKTEVYLRLIAYCLERGRSALMLVPEIALTPSIEAQFRARIGERLAVLHSGLTESERRDDWWRAQSGEAKVVLGTRSAVFAPLADLGVVIVDEEHDPSYKQEETPRYHGRDVAVVRARLAKALAVLGSATPSLESAWNARQGKYSRCLLEERIGGRPLASVEIVDMRNEFRETHTQVPISRRLKEEIEVQLRARAQTLVLLNRRGYSWFLVCRSCGETERCRNCSISLTYHRREHQLICHYCGYSSGIPSACPSCGSEYLHYVGEGTEKLEQKLAEFFPSGRVRRMDRDVARRAGQFRKILSDFREGKIDILVGTQMIAKGHDFPGVTLVGVVSADIGLALPDFRAAERTFQLLTQAAGRAGRGDSPGRVLVQTFYPEHYAIRLAAEQNYEGFFSKEMGFRRMMHYPPHTALANVLAQDSKLERAARVAKQIGDFFARMAGNNQGIKVLGPNPAPLAKIKGSHRIQFLVKAASRARLNDVLHRLVRHCEQQGIPRQSVVIDVDPVSIM